MSILAVVSILASVAAVASGCGGSSRLSSSDLHSRATGICTLASEQTSRINRPPSPSASEPFLRKGITVLESELAQLRKLRSPQAVTDVYAATLTAFAKKLNYLTRAARNLAAGHDAVSTMRRLEARLAPVILLENGGWRALGIRACVNR